MSDRQTRLAEIRARLAAYSVGGAMSPYPHDSNELLAYAPADIEWLLAEVEQWRLIANDLAQRLRSIRDGVEGAEDLSTVKTNVPMICAGWVDGSPVRPMAIYRAGLAAIAAAEREAILHIVGKHRAFMPELRSPGRGR